MTKFIKSTNGKIFKLPSRKKVFKKDEVIDSIPYDKVSYEKKIAYLRAKYENYYEQ